MVRGMSSLGEILALPGEGPQRELRTPNILLRVSLSRSIIPRRKETRRQRTMGCLAAADGVQVNFSFWHGGAGMNLKQVRRSSSSMWLIVLATVFGVIAGVSPAGAFAKLDDPGTQEKKEEK